MPENKNLVLQANKLNKFIFQSFYQKLCCKMIVSDTFAEFQGLISENCAHSSFFEKKTRKKQKLDSPCH